MFRVKIYKNSEVISVKTIILKRETPKVNIPCSQSIFIQYIKSLGGVQPTLSISILKKWRFRMIQILRFESLAIGEMRISEESGSQKYRRIHTIFLSALLLFLIIGIGICQDTLLMKILKKPYKKPGEGVFHDDK